MELPWRRANGGRRVGSANRQPGTVRVAAFAKWHAPAPARAPGHGPRL
jgi:hypothetical protein